MHYEIQSLNQGVQIAHSKTVEEHLEHLDTIFARTLDSNLKMSPEKCKFLAGEIKYLGMIVKDDSFLIAEKKLQAIQDLQDRTYNNLRSQLALFQYYKKLIPFFNDITCVMGKLMKKNVPFLWTQEHTDAHNLLKALFQENLTQTPKPKPAICLMHMHLAKQHQQY